MINIKEFKKSPLSRFFSEFFSLKISLSIVFILFISFIAANSFAAQIQLAWNANTETDLAGYEIYYGTTSGNYGTPINVGTVTNYTVTGLTAGQTYYFGLRAYDSSGNESSFSDEVSGIATGSSQNYSYTVTTSISGLQFVVDGTTYSASQTFIWVAGSTHTLSVPSPQAGASGTRYVFSSWSDGKAQSHTITASAANTTLTANFTKQYSLTTAVNPTGAGTISPSGTNWYTSGQRVSITASASSGYTFSSWSGGLSGTTNSASVTMNGSMGITANFAARSQTGGVVSSDSGVSNKKQGMIDFDNDGKTDIAVWRPGNGTWYIDLSSGASWTPGWGGSGDIPVPSDYDGDGVTDIAVWRPGDGTWYIRLSSGASWTPRWGESGDVPVPGDYDGDGITDIVVWRPSNGTWYIRLSSGGSWAPRWGESGDVPVPGDYDGDGVTDIAVWRPSNGTWYIRLSSGAAWAARWGESGDIPVPGDYDGDGVTDIAVWRPSNGTWYVRPSSGAAPWSAVRGESTDIPVPGDYDGDGITDIAVWRPGDGTWYITLSSSGQVATTRLGLGSQNDVPLSQ